jgi:hypothetical protein
MESRQPARRFGSLVTLAGVLALAAGVPILPAVNAQTAGATGATPTQAGDCAALLVRATPKVNAQNAPHETIRNTVASCATAAETVTLTQVIVGPFLRMGPDGRSWTISLAPGQSVDEVQHIPYSCCGTYRVKDKVLSSAGVVLARGSAGFTFA